jgi:transposase
MWGRELDGTRRGYKESSDAQSIPLSLATPISPFLKKQPSGSTDVSSHYADCRLYSSEGQFMVSTILNRASRRHAYIVFVDEAGFMLGPTLRRTWAPRGQTPVIKIAEPHRRISVIGAISVSPRRRHFAFHYHLSQDDANFHGPSVALFLEYLRRRIKGPITLLWDEIAIHRSKPVTDYLHGHQKMVVEPFPPHAPELNPVDNVWGYVKYNRMANYAPMDLVTLRERLTAEFRRLQKRPDLLKSFHEHTGLSFEPVEIPSDFEDVVAEVRRGEACSLNHRHGTE